MYNNNNKFITFFNSVLIFFLFYFILIKQYPYIAVIITVNFKQQGRSALSCYEQPSLSSSHPTGVLLEHTGRLHLIP